MGLVKALALLLRGWLVPRAHLVIENPALRHQLTGLNRSGKHPQFRPCDRVFWTWLRSLWPGWRSSDRLGFILTSTRRSAFLNSLQAAANGSEYSISFQR